MIPEKTPTLAAIAWITVVLAYAWASNRDYDDAVLAHGSGQRLVASGQQNRSTPLTASPASLTTSHYPLPTTPTGDHK